MLCLFILAKLIPSALAAPAPLDLPAAIRYAIENSPRIQNAERQTLLAEINRKNAFTSFLPKIDLSASAGYRGVSPALGNTWAPTSSFAAQASENLFDNGESIDRYRISSLNEEQSRLTELETRDQLFLEIIDRFYQYSLERVSLEIQEEQFGILKKQYELVASGYKQGLRTRKDYLRFRSDLSRADLDLQRARNNSNLARQELQRLLGSPLDTTTTIDFARDQSPPPLAPLTPLALEQHRQFQAAELEARARRLETRIVKRRVWPELFLTAGATWGDQDFLGPNRPRFGSDDTIDWNAGLTLRYSLLDWGVRSRTAQAAVIQEEISDNERRERLLRLREDMDKLLLNHQQLLEDFRLSRELLELETSSLQLLSAEYRQGKVQYLDYITSLRDRATASLRHQTALFELKKSYYRQQYHQGRLREAIFGS